MPRRSQSPRAVNAFVDAYGVKNGAPADATTPFLTSCMETAYTDASFLRTEAVGGTPVLVAATFLAEYLFLALVAAFVGLLAGWLAAPLLSKPEADLVGTLGAPTLGPSPSTGGLPGG